ncbi:MAG TPA: SCP2 sterol-binding domain-containing protein [Gammaproteobacteria bacterium]
MRIPGMFTALMQMTFDAALDGNDEALQLCERLAGRTVALHFREFDTPLILRPHAGGVEVFNHWRGEPDVTIEGTLPALLFANVRREPGTPAGIRISGDAGIGQEFQKFIRLLDIDWEDRLSRFVGGTVAHRIGRAFREARDFGRQGAARFGDNLREYLQEETRDLPLRREVDEFNAAVDVLRTDIDRAEARLQRLFRRASQLGANPAQG